MKKRYLVNVVWYDGTDAYVSKFIIKEGDEKKIKEYLKFNGEVLKIDKLIQVEDEEIYHFINGTDEEKCAVDRYFRMY